MREDRLAGPEKRVDHVPEAGDQHHRQRDGERHRHRPHESAGPAPVDQPYEIGDEGEAGGRLDECGGGERERGEGMPVAFGEEHAGQ